jgi:predicted permease
MATVQSQLGKQYPETDAKLAVWGEPLKENAVGDVRRSLWILYGSVTLLLLIACSNIAALLLARSTAREHEISVRFSLGASRRTVIGQLLTETFVLSLVGTVVGLIIAGASTQVFRLLAKDLPRVEEIGLDWRIVGYSLLCALAATFICGLLPAWRATSGLSGSLAQHSRTQVAARNPLQWVLVGVQVALAVALLFGAGLLLRSFQKLGRVAPGFDPKDVLTLHISGSWAETADMKALEQRTNRMLDSLRAVPGVQAAATSVTLPGVPGDFKAELQFPEGQDDVSRKVVADSRFISPDYFNVLRISLLEGEACRYTEGSTGIVVNRSFARQYFSTTPALGHHLVFGANSPFSVTGQIRGIVADAREQGLNAEPMPTVYWCLSAANPNRYYLIRTHGEPMAMADTLRRAILQIEPSRAVFDLMPLQAHLSDAFAEGRLRTILLTMFALTAVSLACVGLYGTLSYFVTQRRREIGLRLALGAVRLQIVRRYVLQGLRVASLGCMVGLVLSAGTGKLLSGMLYGVSVFDTITFAGVVLLMLFVAAFAALLPHGALRAPILCRC